ncbi:hypothetical protein [Ensifer adhaerens]|uniref:hypothetical protein n=1 Tax=Ensifer adhaerens TaxID=106592 RepID=UPI001CEFFF9C|nr:hypothetical protein [Ensifer adhaerens]UCM24684.1 hypothetical protein LDL63_33890 [Ensifer adhaerens]
MILDEVVSAKKLSPPPPLLAELSGTPEGRQVLEEAKALARALERRLGSSDPRSFN